MKKCESVGGRDLGDAFRVEIDPRVLSYMLDELQKYPDQEEGGKYVGYVGSGPPEEGPSGSSAQNESGPLCVSIVDFLPGGPRAVRTAVEFMPDGDYQETLFRLLERENDAVEHVGSWHSHHCNGLPTLSDGDVDGYFKTVNKRNYRPHCFVASLVKRVPGGPEESDWIDHFLFVKGHQEYYRITPQLRKMPKSQCFENLIIHRSSLPPHCLSRPAGTSEIISSIAGAPQEQVWYVSEQGRRILAEDRRLFAREFGKGVTAKRKGDQIFLRGRRGLLAVEVVYPKACLDERLTVVVSIPGGSDITISCDVSRRPLVYELVLSVLAKAE